MRKCRPERRAVSTMLGGIIVLTLLISALAAMIVTSRYYDAYQTTVNKMQQRDEERFSENLRAVHPGLVKNSSTVSCPGGQCNEYRMILRNVGIGTQIARIFINSTEAPGCTDPCILDPAGSPTPFRFQASDRYLNPGEFFHNVTLWLPGNSSPGANVTLPTRTFGTNTISVVTTRGRVFAFHWPPPPPGVGAGAGPGGQGGTGLYIGPLVITFQKSLIAYTTNSSGKISLPIGGENGYWVIAPPPLVVYIKIETDVGTPNDVYLTAQSIFEMAQFNSPGNVFNFFIIAPIIPSLCQTFQQDDPTIDCSSSYLGGNNGDPNQIVAYTACSDVPYSSCPNRYKIPKPTPLQLLNHQRGSPVIVAFAARTASGTAPQTGVGGFSPGMSVTSFLGLTYVYNDNTGGGDFVYAVTLPFIAICIHTGSNKCSG